MQNFGKNLYFDRPFKGKNLDNHQNQMQINNLVKIY